MSDLLEQLGQNPNKMQKRFTLKNQKKIQQAYSKKMLSRIMQSLKEYFDIGNIETISIENENREIILISDAGHTSNMIAFYVLSKTFDVYNLAFKEFIG